MVLGLQCMHDRTLTPRVYSVVSPVSNGAPAVQAAAAAEGGLAGDATSSPDVVALPTVHTGTPACRRNRPGKVTRPAPLRRSRFQHRHAGWGWCSARVVVAAGCGVDLLISSHEMRESSRARAHLRKFRAPGASFRCPLPPRAPCCRGTKQRSCPRCAQRPSADPLPCPLRNRGPPGLWLLCARQA